MDWNSAAALLSPYFRPCPGLLQYDERQHCDWLRPPELSLLWASQPSARCRRGCTKQYGGKKRTAQQNHCSPQLPRGRSQFSLGWLHSLPGQALHRLGAALQRLSRPHSGPIFASLNPAFWQRKPDPDAARRHQANIRQVFDEMDVDGNGQLDKKELQNALSRLGLPCSSDYLSDMLQQYDENHDGAVDFSEFEHHVQLRRGAIERAFDRIDIDHSGTISEAELLTVLKHAGVPATAADAHGMVSMLDSQSKGEVSFQEFCRYITLLPDAQVTHDNVVYCWIDSADWLHGMVYRLSMVPPKLPFQRLLAGGIAGAVSRTLVAPFERLRTIMQANPGLKTAPAAQAMWQDGGFLGMFKGNSLTVAKNLPFVAVQFAVYDQAKDALLGLCHKEELSQAEKAAAGCVAGFCSCLAVYPLDMLRTCASMRGAPKGFGPLVRNVLGQTGIAGLYQGLMPALVEECLSTSLGFWAYEQGNALFQRHMGRKAEPSERAVIGGCTACFVMTATLPLLTMSRRLQLQGFMGRPVLYKGVVDCFRHMIQKEGFASLYAGILCSYLKVAPSIGATYGLYALFQRQWGMGGIRAYPHGTMQDPSPAPVDATEEDD